MKNRLFQCALAVFTLAGLSLSAEGVSSCCYEDVCCPADKFNGFYLGANLGVLSHKAHRNDLDGFLTDNAGWSTLDTGFTGGVQLGYDWQCGSRVLGLVADWNGTTVGTKLRDNPNGENGERSLKNDLDWYSTIRARAGVEICNSLIYLTAGAAVSKFDTKWRGELDEFHFSKTKWGWTGGVGAEFALCGNVTVGTDLFFIHFADRKESGVNSTDNFAFKHNDSLWGSRVQINYRFGEIFSRK